MKPSLKRSCGNLETHFLKEFGPSAQKANVPKGILKNYPAQPKKRDTTKKNLVIKGGFGKMEEQP